MEAIYHFDWNVFQFIENNVWNPVLDTIMKFITLSGNKGIIFILAAVIFFAVGFFKKNDNCKKIAIAVVFSILFMEVVNNLFVKEMFERARPFNFDWSQFGWAGTFNFPEIVSKPSSFSFPSGHAASSFAAATAMFAYNKKFGSGCFVFALIMAFSRVYVHVHYCTDVLGGAVIGIIYGLVGILLTKLLYKFLNKKIINPIHDKMIKEK